MAMKTTYDIDNTLNLFSGDAYDYLLDKIINSAPDYFYEDDLERASDIEEGKIKYYSPRNNTDYETVEYVSSSHRK
jgi:hypothetical protein